MRAVLLLFILALGLRVHNAWAEVPGTSPKCADIYTGFPASPVYRVDEVQPGKHPIPGLTHISLHGRRQHGMRGMEMWMETMAPGGGTPIHRHDCEEIWLILQGIGTVYQQGKWGKVESSPLGPNSTFAVLPNARHQVRNTGSEDLQAIITINNLPFRVQPFMYKSWDEPYSAGQEVHPMFWDAECPDYVPPSMQHLADAARESASKPHGGWEDAEAGEEL